MLDSNTLVLFKSLFPLEYKLKVPLKKLFDIILSKL